MCDKIAKLERLSAEVDQLIRAETLGVRSHRQHDACVDLAERIHAIAAGLRADYRGRPAIASNAPLKRTEHGAWF